MEVEAKISAEWNGRFQELQKCLADADPHQASLSPEALIDVFVAIYLDCKALDKQSEGVQKFLKKCAA